MKITWEQLSNRERVWVGGGAILLIIILIYTFLWLPLSNAADRAQSKAHSQVQLLQWMRRADRRIEIARAQGMDLSSAQLPVLLTAVETAFSQCQLSQYIKSVQQSTSIKVSMRLHKVPFDAFIHCVHGLAQHEGITPRQLKVTAAPTPGLVDLQITFVQ